MGAVCAATRVQRAAALSPLETTSSTVKWGSGNFMAASPTLYSNPAPGGSMQTNAQVTTIHRFYEECLNQNRLDVRWLPGSAV
jgi:hypothetical protein